MVVNGSDVDSVVGGVIVVAVFVIVVVVFGFATCEEVVDGALLCLTHVGAVREGWLCLLLV